MKIRFEYFAKPVSVAVGGGAEIEVDADRWKRALIAEREEIMREAIESTVMADVINSVMAQLEGKLDVFYLGRDGN